MFVVFVLSIFTALVVLFVRRRRRQVDLAGLNAERPTFMVEPPTRRVGKRSDGAL